MQEKHGYPRLHRRVGVHPPSVLKHPRPLHVLYLCMFTLEHQNGQHFFFSSKGDY